MPYCQIYVLEPQQHPLIFQLIISKPKTLPGELENSTSLMVVSLQIIRYLLILKLHLRLPSSNFFFFHNSINYWFLFQALVAIGEVTQEIIRGSPDFFPIKPMDYGRFLVISLGTGSSKAEEKYNADQAAEWGLLGWLTSGGSTPLVDVFTQASGDMVDLHLSQVFQALHSEKSYLRIQVQLCCLWLHKFTVTYKVKFLT